MSSAPQLSLDERERRAKQRIEEQTAREARATARKNGTPMPRSARPAEFAEASMNAPVYEQKKGFSPPKPGESLFDNYANLSDPIAFSTDEDEVEELLRMGVGGGGFSWDEERYREANWDPSPHKNPPAYLKSLRPVTREPWTIDAQVYNAVQGDAFGRPERYGFHNAPPLSQYRMDDPRERPKGAREGWNSQPYRTVPYALRGLKPAPTAAEPWVKDQQMRQNGKYGNFEETDAIENLTIEDMDNGGASRMKFFKNYRDEQGSIGGVPAPPWHFSTKTW